jgi:hypothetical protein
MRPKAGEAMEVAVQAHRQDPEVARAIEEVAGYHALLGQQRAEMEAKLEEAYSVNNTLNA